MLHYLWVWRGWAIFWNVVKLIIISFHIETNDDRCIAFIYWHTFRIVTNDQSFNQWNNIIYLCTYHALFNQKQKDLSRIELDNVVILSRQTLSDHAISIKRRHRWPAGRHDDWLLHCFIIELFSPFFIHYLYTMLYGT